MINKLIEKRNHYKQLKDENIKSLISDKNKLNSLINKLNQNNNHSSMYELSTVINKSVDAIDEILSEQNSDNFIDMYNELHNDIVLLFENSEHFDDTGFTPSFTYDAVFAIKDNYFYLQWNAELEYETIYGEQDFYNYSMFEYNLSTVSDETIENLKELLSNIEQLKSNEFSINANYNDACFTLERLLKEHDGAINEKAYNDFVTTIQTGENEAIKLVLNYVLSNNIDYKFSSGYNNYSYKYASIQSTNEIDDNQVYDSNITFKINKIDIYLTTTTIRLHATATKRYKLISLFENNKHLAIKKHTIDKAAARRHAHALAVALSFGGDIHLTIPQNEPSFYARELDNKWSKFLNTSFQDIEQYTDYKIEI